MMGHRHGGAAGHAYGVKSPVLLSRWQRRKAPIKDSEAETNLVGMVLMVTVEFVALILSGHMGCQVQGGCVHRANLLPGVWIEA